MERLFICLKTLRDAKVMEQERKFNNLEKILLGKNFF